MGASLTLLVNPTAGGGRGARYAGAVKTRFHDAGYSVDVLTGASAAEALHLARRAVDDGAETLVAVGGDGLVHLAVQAAAGRSITLGVVPAGTGNDFARALDLPRSPLAAADVVIAGRTATVDAGRVTRYAVDLTTPVGSGWFAGVLATGFDSLVNQRANGMRGGRSRYPRAMLAELRTLRPFEYEITVDGEELSVSAVLVVVANTASYGAGMRIAPDATATDGVLDVTIVEALGRAELLRVFPRVYTGSFVRHPAVRRLRGREVRLSAPGALAFADGERIGPLPLVANVVPGALRVAVPTPGGTPP